MNNIEAIAKLAGIEEKIKKELEKKDSPYAKYIFAMAEFGSNQINSPLL